MLCSTIRDFKSLHLFSPASLVLKASDWRSSASNSWQNSARVMISLLINLSRTAEYLGISSRVLSVLILEGISAYTSAVLPR